MIDVFYMPEQSAKTTSFSPSPSKPKLVVNEWLKQFPDTIKVNSFEPVTEAQIAAVHDAKYVHGVLNGTRLNGFSNRDMSVAKSLPYTSGSMLAAAKHALEYGVAVSPTSGFHHATMGGGGGFCTFNGLMVTAVDLLNTGKVSKVGICDLDQHFSNGTLDIIKVLKLQDKVIHFTPANKYYNNSQVPQFLDRLPKIIRAMHDKGCEILLCQLGCDPHILDPLGGWLDTDQMYQRDLIVYETCKELGMPLVTNLAGGYQEPVSKVVQLHVNAMKACISVYEPVLANV